MGGCHVEGCAMYQVGMYIAYNAVESRGKEILSLKVPTGQNSNA